MAKMLNMEVPSQFLTESRPASWKELFQIELAVS